MTFDQKLKLNLNYVPGTFIEKAGTVSIPLDSVTIYKLVLNTSVPAVETPSAPPGSLGAHLQAARARSGLTLEEFARDLGVPCSCLCKWENGRSSPRIAACGRLIRFLGYDPHPEPTTFAGGLRAFRRRNGLRITDAAALVEVDACTWAAWEAEEHGISAQSKARVEALLRVDLP